jgi:hypothetical protein
MTSLHTLEEQGAALETLRAVRAARSAFRMNELGLGDCDMCGGEELPTAVARDLPGKAPGQDADAWVKRTDPFCRRVDYACEGCFTEAWAIRTAVLAGLSQDNGELLDYTNNR